MNVHAFSGYGAETSSGWKATSPGFFLYVLRARYGDDFDGDAVREFAELNDLDADDLFYYGFASTGDNVGTIGGTIYTPDGFSVDNYGDLYSQWKRELANDDFSVDMPQRLNPMAVQSATNKIESIATAPHVNSNAQSVTTAVQAVTPPPKKDNTMLYILGASALAAFVLFGNKKKR